ncbi:MAG: hypothetical protein OXT09_06895 [Myxococcales bacterium]|nr:hypothetical protein [Myxococcales bacterium]
MMLMLAGACASDPASDAGAAGGGPAVASADEMSAPGDAGGPEGAVGMAGGDAPPLDGAVAPGLGADVAPDAGTGGALPFDGGSAAPVAPEPEPDAGPPAWSLPDGGETSFPWAFYLGLWHVGWTGGLSHHSWMRFHPDASGLAGRWETAPTMCPLCEGYFRCEGADGTFTVDVASQTLHLTMPSSCDPQLQTEQSWTIGSFGDPELQLEPLGSDLKAYFLANGTSNTSASRMPDDYCADLYDCTDVWFDPDL